MELYCSYNCLLRCVLCVLMLIVHLTVYSSFYRESSMILTFLSFFFFFIFMKSGIKIESYLSLKYTWINRTQLTFESMYLMSKGEKAYRQHLLQNEVWSRLLIAWIPLKITQIHGSSQSTWSINFCGMSWVPGYQRAGVPLFRICLNAFRNG